MSRDSHRAVMYDMTHVYVISTSGSSRMAWAMMVRGERVNELKLLGCIETIVADGAGEVIESVRGELQERPPEQIKQELPKSRQSQASVRCRQLNGAHCGVR